MKSLPGLKFTQTESATAQFQVFRGGQAAVRGRSAQSGFGRGAEDGGVVGEKRPKKPSFAWTDVFYLVILGPFCSFENTIGDGHR